MLQLPRQIKMETMLYTLPVFMDNSILFSSFYNVDYLLSWGVYVYILKLVSLFFFNIYSNEYLGTPLSCAAFYGHAHIVRFLLSRDVSCSGSYAELKVSTQPYMNIDMCTL